MTLILDAGALIAVERGDRRAVGLIAAARRSDVDVRTHGGVVAQVWRDGARQAQLARLLAGTDVVPLDERLGRRTGRLLSLTGTTDVVDGAVVALAADGDDIVTSDRGDLEPLAVVAGRHVELLAV